MVVVGDKDDGREECQPDVTWHDHTSSNSDTELTEVSATLGITGKLSERHPPAISRPK